MLLKGLTVRNWRGLNAELAPLSPRLNLIAGPNESGKSRLFEALWFALFESTKGKAQHKKDLESWSGDGVPSVRVVFEIDGNEYVLEKQYLKDAMTRLAGAGKRLQDEEAEDYLHGMLGSRPSKRTGADPSDLGLWPLLWVRQGESLNVASASLNEDTRGRLQDQLANEVGEVTAGPRGQKLLAVARREYERYFTPTGQDGKLLREAAARRDAATAALDEAKRALEETRAAADQLAKVREELAGLAPRLKEREKGLQEARAKLDQAREAKSGLERIEEQVQRLKGELEASEERQRQRAELEQQAKERKEELAAAQAGLTKRNEEEARAQSELVHAEERAQSAEQAHEKAQATLQVVHRAEQWRALKRKLKDLHDQVSKARAAKKELDRTRIALGEVERVTKRKVKALRDVVERNREAEVRLEAAAARIAVKALRKIEVGGKLFDAGEVFEEAVSSERKLRISDVAEITVTPGAGDIARLRDDATDAGREVRERLAEIGVGSLAEAEEVLDCREGLERDLRAGEKRLNELAPDGLESLDAAVATAEGQLAALGETPDGLPDLSGAEEVAREAEAELKVARRARDKAQTVASNAREARATEAAREKVLDEEVERLETRLANLPDAAKLQEQVEQAKTAWQEKLGERSNARRRFDELGGAAAELATEQAQKALATLQSQGQQLRDDEKRLGWEIEHAQEASPYDTMQDAETEYDMATAEHERLQRQSAAARVLWEMLNAKWGAAQQRLTGPVLERIRPYLGIVFPGADVQLDTDLGLVGRSVGGAPEVFDGLSAGAKEQLNLIVRIGMAEVLRGDDTLPLVLDDALVNTDPERIKALQLVLYRAAQNNLQILLFTCHGPLYDSLAPDASFRLPWREEK